MSLYNLIFFLNVSYLLLIVLYSIFTISYLRLFNTKKALQATFFIIVFFTPYSHAIIPLRVLHSDYQNMLPIKFVYFYEIYGLTLFDLIVITIFLINIKKNYALLKTKGLFILMLIVFWDFLSNLYSFVVDPSVLDNPVGSLISFRALLVILNITVFFLLILRRNGYKKTLNYLFITFLIYCIWSFIIIFLTQRTFTFIKYGQKFLLLDQTDTALFLFFIVIGFVTINTTKKYFIYVNYFRTILSGLKTNILFLFFLIPIKKFRKLKSIYTYMLIFIMLSITITFIIGGMETDTSIYTRTFQFDQLSTYYYKENPIFFLTGIGSVKSYKFYEKSKLIDKGAYNRVEEKSNYKIAFQFPFLVFYKSIGLLGLILMIKWSIIMFNYGIRLERSLLSKRIKMLLSYLIPLVVSLVFFSFPGVGYKQFIGFGFMYSIIYINKNLLRKNHMVNYQKKAHSENY